MRNFFRASLLITAAIMICTACDDDAGDHHTNPKEKHTVTFDARNETEPIIVEVEEGDAVARPDAPTNGDMIFGGWCTTVEGATEWDFDTPVISDLILYAKWTEREGVLINGVRWATCNVDDPGTFVSAPEQAGKFYQWNTMTAWPAVGDITGWDSSISIAAEWESANDPSPEGWRVPTGEEIQSLIDGNRVGREATSVNGIVGVRFIDLVTGNNIFLPAAGFRDGDDGALINAASTGAYWCATQRGDLNYYAHYLYFSGDFIDWGSGTKGYGLAVRPVAE